MDETLTEAWEISSHALTTDDGVVLSHQFVCHADGAECRMDDEHQCRADRARLHMLELAREVRGEHGTLGQFISRFARSAAN